MEPLLDHRPRPQHVSRPGQRSGTYHRAYVTVGGKLSNSYRFYIDPARVIDASTPISKIQALFPNTSVIKKQDVTYNNASDSRYVSKHRQYTTHLTLDASRGLIDNGWGNMLIARAHNILFKDITFICKNNDASTGTSVLSLGYDGTGDAPNGHQYNLTFENCVITNNLKTVGEGSNGIKVTNCSAGRIGDWTFSDCSIGTPNSRSGSFGRMGCEMNEGLSSYTDGACLQHIRFTGCDFEPCGTMPFSFAMNSHATEGPDRDVLIDDCIMKGVAALTTNGWGKHFIEFHSKGLVVRDVDMWGGAQTMLTSRGDWAGLEDNPPGTPAPRDCHMYFKRLDLKTRTRYSDYVLTPSDTPFNNVSYDRGMIFDDCDFDMGTASYHWDLAASANLATNVGWDMSTSYMHGVCGEGHDSPTCVYDYFSYWGCTNPATTYAHVFGPTRWAHFGTRP